MVNCYNSHKAWVNVHVLGSNHDEDDDINKYTLTMNAKKQCESCYYKGTLLPSECATHSVSLFFFYNILHHVAAAFYL